jgi:hypothetical protein
MRFGSSFSSAFALVAWCWVSPALVAQSFVQFDFDDTLDPTTETGIIFALVSPPAVEFDPLHEFQTAQIGGDEAGVLYFDRGTYFRVQMGFGPNGGGDYVNQYTIVMDVLFPDRFDDTLGPASGFVSLFNSNVDTPPTNDGEAFISAAGGIGLGTYGGTVADGDWHRIAIAFDLAEGVARFYVDGELEHQVGGLARDGGPSLWSVNDGGLEGISLFGDNDAENASGFINSLQIWDTALPAGQVAALGGPSAEGIPTPDDLDTRDCFHRDFAATVDLALPKVTLTWGPVFGDAGFEILRGGTVISGRLAATATSFIDASPPAAGRDVEYTLRTFFAAEPDRECSLSVDTFACLGALVSCADGAAGTVDLDWEPAQNLGHAGYEISRNGAPIVTVGPAESSYRDPGVPAGVHSYTVRATGVADGVCAAEPSRTRAVVAPRLAGTPACGGDIAQWDLDADLESSTGQAALEAIGYPDFPGAPDVEFVAEEIAGLPTTAARISQGTAFVARHDLVANGGGVYLNEYSLIIDIKFPVVDKWISLLQTNDATILSNGNDGDWFVSPDNAIGAGGVYGGEIEADRWYRLALVVSHASGTLQSYVDGLEVQELSGLGFDGRWSLYTRVDATPWAILFADETAGAEEMGELVVASVQLRDYAMSAGEIAGLGGPSASGIPVVSTVACPDALRCCADTTTRSVALEWLSSAGLGELEVRRNGTVVGSVPAGATSFVDTDVPTGEHVYELDSSANDGSCANLPLSCRVSMPDAHFFFDAFDCYASDDDVDARGWQRIDSGGATETATWTILDRRGGANPPRVDGRATSGAFLISDSDFGGGPNGENANAAGTGMSHDLISPTFSTIGESVVWLHVDLIAQLNNNGDAVFAVEVSTDGGVSWDGVFERVSPGRSIDPLPSLDDGNADGFYGRLDVDLSAVAADAADVRVRLRHFEPTWEWFIAVDNFLVDAHATLGGEADLLPEETFLGGIPGAWDVEFRGQSDGFSPWDSDDPCSRSLLSSGGVFPDIADGRQLHHFDAAFVLVDPGCTGAIADEYLVTPAVDASNATMVWLHLGSTILPQDGEIAEILLSLDGGGSFLPAPIFSYAGGGRLVAGEEPFHNDFVLPVPLAAGEARVAFAFHYVTNGVAASGWWAIDDVRVSAVLESGGTLFHRGDVNADALVNITDGIAIFNFLFLGGADPVCRESADANNDAAINITDGIFILNFLFLGGDDPPAPGPAGGACGPDPDAPGSDGDLGCAEYPPCA